MNRIDFHYDELAAELRIESPEALLEDREAAAWAAELAAEAAAASVSGKKSAETMKGDGPF